jgi:hypothetical protein
MPSLRVALLLAACLLVPLLAKTAPAAAGGPPGLIEPNAPTTRTVHYGYQTFIADALWIGGSMVLAKADDGGGGGELIALGYYGGGPAVHLLHHNRSAAAKSLGLRVLLPVAGAVAGLVLSGDRGDDGFEAMYDAMIGFAAGAVTAMVVDWTVLSKQSVDVPHVGTLSALRPGMKIGKDSATVSVAGSF